MKYSTSEQAIIRDSERIAAEYDFIFGRGWLDEAEHYYERRKGEREDELIRGNK